MHVLLRLSRADAEMWRFGDGRRAVGRLGIGGCGGSFVESRVECRYHRLGVWWLNNLVDYVVFGDREKWMRY